MQIVSRSEHTISRNHISENALKVLYRLKKAGYEGYLVGGGVRDLLLGGHPKDFDIATDATPEEVKSLFRNCRLIGRRFRLAHVHFGREIIEVATFRGQHEGDEGEKGQIVNGMIVRDNVYGSLEEDAWRRDFSINSLYYNIRDFSVVDYVGGMRDLEARQLRLIGDPETRYKEDPVRLLRAVRFAAKLNFSIEPQTEAPIFELAHLLHEVPPARLFEEMLKLFLSGHGEETYKLLRKYGLFGALFEQTEQAIDQDDGIFEQFLLASLANSDNRVREGKPVTPAFILAAFLWEPVRRLRAKFLERGMSDSQAMAEAASAVISGQSQHISIPRRFHTMIKEIWNFQDRLSKRAPKRSVRLLSHPRYRAGYDFLVLRAQAGDAEQELADWWTTFAEADESERDNMLKGFQGEKRRRRRRRKPRVTN